MEDNVVSMHKNKKQLGLTLSFVVTCDTTRNEILTSQMYLEQFHDAVQSLVREGFPKLKATVTARTEYLP